MGFESFGHQNERPCIQSKSIFFHIIIFFLIQKFHLIFSSQSLCEALSTLPHLIHLDLRCNLITASGLNSLAETLQANASESNHSAGLKVMYTSRHKSLLICYYSIQFSYGRNWKR